MLVQVRNYKITKACLSCFITITYRACAQHTVYEHNTTWFFFIQPWHVLFNKYTQVVWSFLLRLLMSCQCNDQGGGGGGKRLSMQYEGVSLKCHSKFLFTNCKDNLIDEIFAFGLHHESLNCKWRANENPLTNVWFPFMYSQKCSLISYLLHSYICERFIYLQDQSAYFASARYVDRSWECINRSQAHECGNWDWGRAEYKN